MKRCFALLVLLSAATCAAQDFMYETFDTYLLGPINARAGWESTNFAPVLTNTQPAGVDNDHPARGPNHLVFPAPTAGKQATMAMYTNFNAQYGYTGTDHPVLRASFMLYKQAAHQNFWFVMGPSNDFISIGTDTNDGTIVVNGVDTGVPFVTNRYTEMACLYNMSNDQVCVQYDGTNIVEWSGVDAPSLTQIVQVAFFRLPDQSPGLDLFVDHVRVDRPTPAAVAWFRYETPTNIASDHAGFFRATKVRGFDNRPVSASSPLCDGVQERANDLGQASFRLTELLPWTNTAKMTEWTLEAILAANPAALDIAGNLQIIDWATLTGHNTTNAQILFVWSRTTQKFSGYLRDAQQTTTANQYLSPLGDMPADGRWHHVAFVKTGAWLTVYVDYRVSVNYPLDGTADGDYEFYATSHAGIGESLSAGNMSNPHQLLDELRFTARALRTGAFLQFGQPWIVTTPNPTDAIWDFEAMTISGRLYNVQTAPMPGAAIWTDILPATVATGHYTRFFFAAPTNRILRVIRP